jgi:hypothetical protein
MQCDNLFVNHRRLGATRRIQPGFGLGRREGKPRSPWNAGPGQMLNPSGVCGSSQESQEER